MEIEQGKVAVIIPTYKPDEKFEKLMDRLQRQKRKPDQIIVIHTIPDQGTSMDVALKYKDMDRVIVHEIPQREFNHGGTRNLGVKMVEADFVLMMTQDAVPADDRLIDKLLEAFKDSKVAAAYARQLATKEVGIIENYTRQFNYPEKDRVKSKKDIKELGIKTYFCSDVCAMYRKSAYEEMGGFVTKTIFNEDMILASNLIDHGYYVAYAANAKVYHAHRYTGKQQFQRNFDLGVSHRQYREIFEKVKSESEGMKLVKQTASYLIKKGHPLLLGELVWQSGWKFLGYQMGKRYDKLPLWFIRMASSQKSYWIEGKE